MNEKSKNQRLSLFPPVVPFATGWLAVGDGHEIHFQRSGNPDGEPLLFIHGGPGSGSSGDQRRLFDPQKFHIVQFDQRCCGLSRWQGDEAGKCTGNTTGKLVADMVLLLNHLNIEKIHMAGGSWGSTLALAFGVEHPHRLKSLLLYGIFLCRPCELRALYFPGGVAQSLFPEAFEDFLAPLASDQRSDPIAGYASLFQSENADIRHAALRQWTRFEKRISRLQVDEVEMSRELEDMAYVKAHSEIENQYFRHDCFLNGDRGGLLQRVAERLALVPTHIVNGRYDIVCPPRTAFELHKALPHSTLTIVPDAGHSFREPGLSDAIIRIAGRLADLADNGQ